MDIQIKNATSRAGLSDVYDSVQPREASNKFNSKCPESLSQEIIDKLIECLPPRAFQAKRFVMYVAKNPKSKTGDCNIAAAAVNLSDIAVKYNPYLKSQGYELKCELPAKLIKNRFGEDSMAHLWYLNSLSEGVQS